MRVETECCDSHIPRPQLKICLVGLRVKSALPSSASLCLAN